MFLRKILFVLIPWRHYRVGNLLPLASYGYLELVAKNLKEVAS